MLTYKELQEKFTFSAMDMNPDGSSDRPLTRRELKALERQLSAIWSAAKTQVIFTNHFIDDRINDARNGKAITIKEIETIYNQVFRKYGAKLFNKLKHRKDHEIEGVMKKISNDLNVPFAISWDNSGKHLRLRAITVMRKKNFRPKHKDDLVLTVEAVDHTVATIEGLIERLISEEPLDDILAEVNEG